MASNIEELSTEVEEHDIAISENGLRPVSEDKPVCEHNFPDNKDIQWELMSLATGSNCKKGREIINEVFGLKYWFMENTTINGQGGQAVAVTKTVLFNGSDQPYYFYSKGVERSLRLLVSIFGKEVFDPPKPIMIAQSNDSAGRTHYSIIRAPKSYETEE